MRQIQNRDNQACNSNDNHKLFVCTHKHPLLCKTQGEECSRPTGCRGKYIICARVEQVKGIRCAGKPQ